MAATIDGDFVVTSPNQEFIWETPQGAIFLRSDSRFGPHDPTLLPQPYVSEYPYLGAIPSRPMDEDDPLSMMWWNPTRGDFISSSGGIIDGIGKLRRARYEYFRRVRKQLEERIRLHLASQRRRSLHDILLLLERDLANASSRLGSLQMTFSQMVFDVTEFQRCYLEICGFLDYLEVYIPRIGGQVEAATTVANCVGAITSTPQVVQDFFTAGLPVWFIQPLNAGSFPHRVLNVVTSFKSTDFVCIGDADPPFPVVYDGALTNCEKHNALHRFSRRWLVFKDPFQHQPSSTTSASTSTWASTSSVPSNSATRAQHCKCASKFASIPFLSTSFQASKPQAKQSGGRDKFAPLDSPLAPFSIPAWGAALQAVERFLVSQQSSHYAFPDPGLFVSPATKERKAKFIEAWLRVRSAWIVHVRHDGSSMSSQHWRDLLSTDLSTLSGLSNTKALKRRQHILNILIPSSPSDPGVKPRSTVGEPFFWNGCSYLPGVLPAENVVRQILWELYELNFTCEFISLDRRACENLDLSDNEKLLERESLISKCFVIDTFKSVPLPNINCGLAADNLRERLPYLQKMVFVMKAWKGIKPPEFYRAVLPLVDQQVEDLEKTVSKYYCQQFYCYFGRAAQVPHRLFPMDNIV